jgi:regulator of protease activity HflC (stomatin/prohibitin superfamily)
MDVIGEKRAEFLDALTKEVAGRVGDWWVVDYLTFAGKLRMDPRIEASINSIIEQKQKTAQSELQVKQIRAQADQAVAQAEGEARSKKAIAEGEAQAILAKAEAQAKANELLSKSLSPNLVQYEALHRWDGKLPVYSGLGSAVPVMNMSITNR